MTIIPFVYGKERENSMRKLMMFIGGQDKKQWKVCSEFFNEEFFYSLLLASE